MVQYHGVEAAIDSFTTGHAFELPALMAIIGVAVHAIQARAPVAAQEKGASR